MVRTPINPMCVPQALGYNCHSNNEEQQGMPRAKLWMVRSATPQASGPGRPQALTNSGGTDKNVAGPVWYSAKKGYELNQLISMIIDDIDDLCSCSTIPNIYIYWLF